MQDFTRLNTRASSAARRNGVGVLPCYPESGANLLALVVAQEKWRERRIEARIFTPAIGQEHPKGGLGNFSPPNPSPVA